MPQPIDSPTRKNFSKDGKIGVIKRKCKDCGNNKAFSKPSGIYCTRCRKSFDG